MHNFERMCVKAKDHRLTYLHESFQCITNGWCVYGEPCLIFALRPQSKLIWLSIDTIRFKLNVVHWESKANKTHFMFKSFTHIVLHILSNIS